MFVFNLLNYDINTFLNVYAFFYTKDFLLVCIFVSSYKAQTFSPIVL